MPLSNLSRHLALPVALLGASSWLLRHALPTPVAVMLLHTSVTGAALVVAATDELIPYSHALLGKSHTTGQLAPWSYVVWWPYHALSRVRIALKRRKSKEPLWNEVIPGWYLGGWPFRAADLPPGRLAEVDMTCELPASTTGPYYNIQIFDTMAPTVAQTSAAVDWALRRSAEGLPVYVFCQNGHGRSAVVMAAALVAGGHARDWREAVAMIQRARPRAKLNQAQHNALVAWAERSTKSS